MQRIVIVISVIMLGLSLTSTASARTFCEKVGCCPTYCYEDCVDRPGADVAPECRSGHKFTHDLGDGDLLCGGCISPPMGTCEPDVPDDTEVDCKTRVRSCMEDGKVKCGGPSTPNPAGTNNLCRTPGEPNPKVPNYDHCPKFACAGGVINNDDTDGDGLFDCWENQGGIDADADGILDWSFPVTVSPTHRDIFVEVDWFDCAVAGSDCTPTTMHSHEPNGPMPGANVMARAALEFGADPNMNPDGNTGTNLIVLPGGEALPHMNVCGFDSTCFDNIKAASFGTPLERARMLTIWAKRVAVRYAVFMHDQALNDATSGNSGVPGANFVVTLGTNWARTPDQQLGTFMHELGHTLGLRHGGVDDVGNKPNYFSLMNYLWQQSGTLSIFGPSFSYSAAMVPTLNELALSEPVGVQSSNLVLTDWFCPNGRPNRSAAAGPINWDCVEAPPAPGMPPVAMPTAVGLTQDVNYDRVCVLPGINGQLNTVFQAGDAVRGGLIFAGPNGVLDSVPAMDDFSTLIRAQSVYPGINGTIDSVPVNDDFIDPVTNTIDPGPDNILQTMVLMMDDFIAAPFVVDPGPDAIFQSAVAFDDILRLTEIWDDADRICQTTPNPMSDDQSSVIRHGTPVGTAEPNLLLGHDDWRNMTFDFTPSLKGFRARGPGSPPPPEPNAQDAQAQQRQRTVADLRLSVESTRILGNTIKYEIVVNNAGPSSSIGAAVNLRLPSGVSFVSCSSPLGACTSNANYVTIAVGSLANGGEVTVVLTVNSTGSLPTGTKISPSVEAVSSDSLRSNNRATICAEPPRFTSAPSPLPLSACEGVTLPEPAATSLCGLKITMTNDAPSHLPLGTTTITWTATDAEGGVATTTQQVTTTLADDASCCPVGTNIILGNALPNILLGTNGSDCILGRGGLDTISGLGGNDFISGGAGTDLLNGDAGDDVIFGGDGIDTLSGGLGTDVLNGGPGIDVCGLPIDGDTRISCEL